MSIIQASGTVRPAETSLTISIKFLDDNAVMPSRSHPTDAGLDLHSIEGFTLSSGERRIIDTGVAITIPKNCVGMVCPRSGLAAKNGITVVNAPGIIDSGYKDSIKVVLLNTSQSDVSFAVGDRIAQLVISPIVPCSLAVVDELGESDRGLDGFGSTGR